MFKYIKTKAYILKVTEQTLTPYFNLRVKVKK